MFTVLGLGFGFLMKGSRFLSRPFIIRVPFFLILSFNKGTLKQKGQKGTTQFLLQALIEARFHSSQRQLRAARL